MRSFNYTKSILKLTTLLLFIVSVSSCQKSESNSPGNYWLDYGFIVGDSPDFKIRLDDEKTTLIVVSNYAPTIELEDGDRVIVNYTIVEDAPAETSSKPTSYNVVVNDIKRILTKAYLIETEISEDKDRELGYDKADIAIAWISSGHLNINFYSYTANAPVNHFVNLVLDDRRSTATRKYFTFRHNAYEDVGTIQHFGRVSFDIKDIIQDMESGDRMEFVLQWDSYMANGNRETITYIIK